MNAMRTQPTNARESAAEATRVTRRPAGPPADAPRGARMRRLRRTSAGLEALNRSLLRSRQEQTTARSRTPAAGETQLLPADEALRDAQPGDRLGAYKLLQQIGEGGFGVVYLAEQVEPVVRRVAVKVIKLGMDTRQVVARFDAERQALAMMDHPAIARVLDAGATESGRPFFVMELVKGVPITEYCDANDLSICERLNLFTRVCEAVQHAHHKGVVHRDIKPSNVLVTRVDSVAAPKIIDFGIAKATGARLTQHTLFTEPRQFIGTPQYMSPEQADGSTDIDTRTDIYSLGVLLYELLTGATPFDTRTLREGGLAQLQRTMLQHEPPRPSTRVTSAGGAAAAEIARRRRTDPATLRRVLRGDLDWIVMRCLERDRGRRYDTASSLARDIHAHLAHQPVSAGPPSATYWMRKFVRRHRAGACTTVLVAFALALGAIGTLAGWVQARSERDRAIASERLARAAERRARANEQFALAEAAQHPELARRLEQLARTLHAAGHSGAARQLDHEALEIYIEHLGPGSREAGLVRARLAGAPHVSATSAAPAAAECDALIAERRTAPGLPF